MFTPEMMMPTGPPPQAVLDQRYLWQILHVLLGVTFILRLVGLDIAGALLSGLMLCFAVIMTRDGMQEMAKYALIFAVLCVLNFFFDILPLVTELGGRVSRHTEPVSSVTGPDGLQKTMYTVTTKTTPFFDLTEGFVYNVQSLAMLMSPISMLLGVYLSITAHNEIQRHAPPLFDDDFTDLARQVPQFQGQGQTLRNDSGPRPTSAGTSPGVPGQRMGRDSFERFHGESHKLGS